MKLFISGSSVHFANRQRELLNCTSGAFVCDASREGFTHFKHYGAQDNLIGCYHSTLVFSFITIMRRVRCDIVNNIRVKVQSS